MIKLFIVILLIGFSLKSLAQNIGIGTTTPSEKLDVSGNIKGDTAKVNSLKIALNASTGKVLTSDVNGVASWQIATGAVNAKNGLTLTNDSVKLGGIVTENTMLRLNTKSLLITDTGSISTLSINQLSFPEATGLSAVPVTQTVTAISNSTLSAVEIYVAAFGGSSITVQVKNAANTVLGTVTNTYSSIFNNWSSFTFSNILLTNTQVYTLSVTATGTAQIHHDNTNPYANGVSSINSTADISFKIFNTEEKHLFFLQGNKIGVNNSNPTATLDIAGSLKITDGTQAAGKILMSDATGKSTWQPLTGASIGGWGTSGNAGTTAINFIGTTDNTSLQFKINNGHAGKINTDGSVSIGRGALQNNPVFIVNTAIGDSALYSNTSGLNNTAVGTNTLYSNTSGLLNTAVGYSALQKNTTGNGNSSFGAGTLQNNTVGLSNTAVGFNTLASNIGGLGNTGLGNSSLISNTTGNFNTAMGLYALLANITGSQNVGIGFKAMYLSDAGSNNIGIGANALYSNTGGSNNVAIGIAALRSSANRSNLVAVGDSALLNNGIGAVDILDGTENTALGSKALFANNLGSLNTAVGFKSLYNNTIGVSNTATGTNTLFSNTTGNTNTATGSYALGSNTTGSANAAHGTYALLYNTTGSSNVANGSQAL